jgi:hypothetical protein
MRFFMKAIANYDEGLQKHPAAFDLAYNKYVCEIRSEEVGIVFHCKHISIIPETKLDVLREFSC